MVENHKLFQSKIQLLFTLLYNGYLKDRRLFKAFLDVQLKEFIPLEILPEVESFVYNDRAVPFYFDREHPETLRTISAPHMISIMLQELMLKKNDDLLILGAKSGYISALAHKLAPEGKVLILEANSNIAEITSDNLTKLNLQENVDIIVKNPLEGMLKLAPWQKILVTGAIQQERIYPLLNQLDPNEGVLFAPVGEGRVQTYTQIMRIRDEFYGKKHLQVSFTPLITQIELDQLELVLDFDEEIETNEAHTEIKLKPLQNINIKYTTDIVEKVNLEPHSEETSFVIRPYNVYFTFLEHIKRSIEILNKEPDLTHWDNSIDNYKLMITVLKKLKNKKKPNFDLILKSIDQLKTYNLIRKEITSDQIPTSELLEEKVEIIKKQLRELTVLQDLIKSALDTLIQK